MQKIQTPNLLYEQVLCILKAVKVSYIDCHGHLIGDCTTCAGSGGGEGAVTNSLVFNPTTNTLTSIVNGEASSVLLTLNDSDVTISGSIVVGGVTYNPGTSIQTVLTALSVSGGGGTSVTVTDSLEINLTLTGQDITATLQQQGAGIGDVLAWNGTRYAPATLPPGTLPSGSLGAILVHDGTGWQVANPIEESQSGITGTAITLAAAPLSFARFNLFKNGVRQKNPEDYTRSGVNITMIKPITSLTRITAEYYI